MGNHQSWTLLFDPETGKAPALVRANYLTGARTSASSAIVTKYFSCADSNVLGIIGAGVQAQYQLKATMAVRNLTKVHAWDPSAENVAKFGEVVTALGLEFVGESDCEAAVSQADILLTVTPSQKPLVDKAWVRSGTHISAMGSDTKGKQELDPVLVAVSAMFVDEVQQAMTVGEFQHAFGSGQITESSFRASFGQVIEGISDGRIDDDEVTIFDGTGLCRIWWWWTWPYV